jgi:hypothetical protein
MTGHGAFSRGGGLRNRATPRLKAAIIEERISQILNLLDRGGPSVGPDRRGSDAVRKAIKRVSQAHKLQCDRYLDYNLKVRSHH